ncbi:hypothetical protein NAEGRDRAFT_63144 [Naegleria gruberi]|uniref:Folliculin n=1 Tax=Naegleria gruberi TaxID=5762 RepID=D2V2W8_NAEGR|nr:uncharacterized protein NAEGRDRAFT_63144 [Naegleria gruberi]EFC49133.1 hypothetical protein NAEGRDRAFT_63144 [Naegleria gruberi]|eukprot:XP_002681877.1 hypothetical protein NAEGRDRAFT_63144 [Naegleria gruberi strain NEG-M]
MINNIHDISHLEKFVLEQHKTTQIVSHHQHHHRHQVTEQHKTSSTSTSSPPSSTTSPTPNGSEITSTTPLQESNSNSSSTNNLDITNLENLDHPQTISSLASKDLMLHLKKYYPNLFGKEHNSNQQEENDHFNQLLMLSSIEQLTIDRDNEQIFVSSHQESSKFSAHFKTLAIRSTSAEISVGQGREGPVLFGDEINGYNFAYIFKVKDSMARGFARWFAIVLMDTSLSMLTISWPFLNSGMGRIVKLIRARSQQIFLEEKEKQKRSGSSNALNEDGTNAEDHGYRFFHSGGPLSADVFRQKRSKGPMRDLPLLLNYPDFYSDLHNCFSGLLQSFYSKLSEIELDNSNYQKLDMYNNYSIPSCEMPRIRSFISNSSITSNESDSPSTPANGCFNLLSDFSKMVKKSLFNKVLLERNLFIGIELADTDDANEESYTQSEEMIKSLIYNVLIGNQLIVRSDNVQMRNEICRLFTTIVPKECAKMVQDSESYVFPYDANFLTVPKHVQITEDSVDFRFVILLDIEGYSSNDIEEISIHTEQEYKETTLGKEIEKLFFQTIFTHVQQYSTTSNMDYNTLYDIEQNILKSLIHDWSRRAKFFIQANKRHVGENLPMHIQECDTGILRYFGSTISLKKSFSQLNMNVDLDQ